VLFRPNLSGPHDTAYFGQAVEALHDVAWPAAGPDSSPPADSGNARTLPFGAFAWGHRGSRSALLADWSASDLLSPAVARTVQLMQQVSLDDAAPQVIVDT
jgi:hypothetical protein